MSGEMYEGTIEPSRLCKYYCPICMLYFLDLSRTACCANYICYECAVQYVQVQRSDTLRYERTCDAMTTVLYPSGELLEAVSCKDVKKSIP
jgi:hypothetical protein